MKMTAFEKFFVNRPAHASGVADHALRLLSRIEHQPGWRYLDAGCGVGSSARRIAGATEMEVMGIDVDPEQIEAARGQNSVPNLHFSVMDATMLEFGDSEFDIVATRMAFHHIRDWEKALHEMLRVLRTGGYLILSDFVFPSWLAKAGRNFVPLLGYPARNEIEFLASGAGLAKVHEACKFVRMDMIWSKEGDGPM